jgi:PhoPQ-activated pathogenicity-related protein
MPNPRPFFLLLTVVVLPMAAFATALDDYVHAPDPAYGYTLLNTYPHEGYTDYVLEMTSQTWRSAEEVDVPLWTHHLVLTVPDEVTSEMGVLFIGGGGSGSEVPESNDVFLVQMALECHAVCAELKQIPNQPITFLDDPTQEARKEDSQIAYGWNKFLRTGDPLWLARFPMTKAAVRAMDTITEFMGQSERGDVAVKEFIVAGGSKRGWTTWTTAAVDKRVVAFAPFVIDLLNFEKSFLHHYAVLGHWAEAIDDYVNQGIMEWQGTRPYHDLLALVDPYSYLDRYASKQKYVYNAAGDEFFLPDSSQFYFADLPGPKHLRYLPNVGHGLDERAYQDFIAWTKAVTDGATIPSFTWIKKSDGTLVVNTAGAAPAKVLLWQATNSVRDFNHTLYGDLYTSTELTPSAADEYIAAVVAPEKGFTAYFVEITYPGTGTFPLRFTTEVCVVPNTFAGVWDRDTDGDGQMDSVDSDDDNDGVPDASDARPRDTDNDGIPNHADDDDDNDGAPDVAEAAAGTNPLDAASRPANEGAPSLR